MRFKRVITWGFAIIFLAGALSAFLFFQSYQAFLDTPLVVANAETTLKINDN